MAFPTKFVTLLACIASLTTAQNSYDPVVDLGYAQYRGVQNASIGVTTWFGIKYAQPPTGNLRWQRPREIEYSSNPYDPTTVIDATEQGPICIQVTAPWNITTPWPSLQPGQEDCLLLDVLVPQSPVSKRLPVIVQIHGGGYAGGNSESYPGYIYILSFFLSLLIPMI